MVDNFTPQDPTQAPMDAAAVPVAAGKTGFFSSSRGRLIAIVVAVVVIVVLLGAAAFFVYTFFMGAEPENGSGSTGPGGTKPTSGSAAVEETETVPLEPGDVSLGEIYTFRDIFEPLIKPSEETSPEGSIPESGTPEAAADTLYLQDIIVKDGVPTAVLIWNGTEYPLAEGGVIEGTPWQVLAIHGGTVTMLYGDAQVTLTVGQGISK